MFSLKNVTPTITDMIRFDHSHVLLTWHQYVSTKKPTVKKAARASRNTTKCGR
jgi:hypothetical protein